MIEESLLEDNENLSLSLVSMINSDEMSEESLEEDEDEEEEEERISLSSSTPSEERRYVERLERERLEENSELHQLCLEEKQENLIERIQNLLQNGADPTEPNQV